MRLNEETRDGIRAIVARSAGTAARVRVFGSRLDDNAKGGDLDLLLECAEEVVAPAALAATVGARVSRLLHGRKVDVVVSAPNLASLPIHDIARLEGELL